MARALGIGGVFFKANDPQKLMSWYENVLGVVAQRYGNTGSSGVPFNLLALPAEAYVQWSAAPRDSKHYDGDFMFNFVVDDVDEVLKQVRAHGGTMVREPFDLENVGRFRLVP
jgi:predicted enzyme related to lactoylglutathione lyase